MSREPRTIALCAGEASGDLLGGHLVEALKKRYPGCRFIGIAGRRMIEQGCEDWYPSEALAVFGLWDYYRRKGKIFKLRDEFRDRLLADPPDLFIGIDAPDFNLQLETWLREKGIPTVHYVSPSVWAWRPKRMHKIKPAVDLMLTLFPFEAKFYEGHDVPVEFVGHPLADALDPDLDPMALRRDLGLHEEGELLCLMPGSRTREVALNGPVMAATVRWLSERRPGLRFVAPMANAKLRSAFAEQLGSLPVTLLDGHSHEAMGAADAVLLASGTAALEAMILRRPMVVVYIQPRLSWWHMKRTLYVPWLNLPNNILGRGAVEEFVQENCTVDAVGPAVVRMLDADHTALMEDFDRERLRLKRNASEAAATAIDTRFFSAED
ncbi:MAG: lipid-A-disaccharide synthase [Gammaproteobacteria bacterium]